MNFADWAPVITAVGTVIAAMLPLYIRQGHNARRAKERTDEVLALQERQHKENSQKLDLIAKQTNGELAEAQRRIRELEALRTDELRALRLSVRDLEQQLRAKNPEELNPPTG